MSRRVGRNLYETVCRQNANKLPSRIFVHKSSPLSTLPLMIPEYIYMNCVKEKFNSEIWTLDWFKHILFYHTLKMDWTRQ